MNTENKNSNQAGSVAILALVRLAFLVGPEAIALKTLWHNPLACVLMCVGILAIWLSVDLGPFRAEEAPAKAKATKFTVVESVGRVACRLIVFAFIIQERLNHF